MMFFIGFILVMFSGLLQMVCGDFCYYRRHITSKTNNKYELEGRQEMINLSLVSFIIGVILMAVDLFVL
jgi:hypothetical protein